MSDVERKAAFAQLEKIFVSVKIGSQNKSDAVGTLKAEATKEDNAKESTSQAPGTDAAKTAAKLEQNPR